MSSCPVYAVEHIESHVARGRNALIDWAANSAISRDKSYREALTHCLLCRRCETVCPANVPSTDVTLQARSMLVAQNGLTWGRRWVHGHMLAHRALFAGALRLLARLPLFFASKGSPLRHMADFASVFTGEHAFPRMSRAFLSKCLPQRSDPPKDVRPRGEVAIFPGCAFEFFSPHIGQSMVSVLNAAGYTVYYPPDLTCCGFAIYSAGDLVTARQMAARNIDALSRFERVITGCATCGSTLKNYANWFSQDDPLRQRAQNLSERTEEFSKFLIQSAYRPSPLESGHITVTYHDPCHLKWYQGIVAEPRELLRSLEGATYIEMPDADQCCGMGGSFGISCRDTSKVIADKKMASVRKAGADVLVTACPGCLLQLSEAVRRNGLPVEVLHISELLHGQKGPLRKPR